MDVYSYTHFYFHQYTYQLSYAVETNKQKKPLVPILSTSHHQLMKPELELSSSDPLFILCCIYEVPSLHLFFCIDHFWDCFPILSTKQKELHFIKHICLDMPWADFASYHDLFITTNGRDFPTEHRHKTCKYLRSDLSL